MTQEEFNKYKPEPLFPYNGDYDDSLWINIVNPNTAREFNTRFEDEIVDYLKATDIDCCVDDNFSGRLKKFYATIDYKKGNLNRYNELVDYLLNDKSEDCKASILAQHKDFIESIADRASEYPNIDPALFPHVTDEERTKAWIIHTTLIISKIVFSGCKVYKAEIKKWKDAQGDQLLWDMYILGGL